MVGSKRKYVTDVMLLYQSVLRRIMYPFQIYKIIRIDDMAIKFFIYRLHHIHLALQRHAKFGLYAFHDVLAQVINVLT